MLNDTFRPGGGVGGPFSPTLPVQFSPSQPLSGNGPPEGIVAGIPGATWVDLLTADLWQKIQSNGAFGWKLIGKVP